MINRLSIIHFHPLEKYPPVMNMINLLAQNFEGCINVYSTNNANGNWYKASSTVKIKRFGRVSQSALQRYHCYIYFALRTFLSLLLSRPSRIFIYETYSCLPVFIYNKLFRKSEILIHYHEYVSQDEINRSTGYYKLLSRLEKNLLKNAKWISHTNQDRVRLFSSDHAYISQKVLRELPNYPPVAWYRQKAVQTSDVVKIVYTGALGLDTMYLKEFANWVHNQNGRVTWTIFSDNINPKAKDFLQNLNSPYISLLDAVSYFCLPEILADYDVGVVLYNGSIPNYVFNIPNKVIEYYSCGLSVWCSKDLTSTKKFVEEFKLRSVAMIDFRFLENAVLPVGLESDNKVFSAEDAYCEFSRFLHLRHTNTK